MMTDKGELAEGEYVYQEQELLREPSKTGGIHTPEIEGVENPAVEYTNQQSVKDNSHQVADGEDNMMPDYTNQPGFKKRSQEKENHMGGKSPENIQYTAEENGDEVATDEENMTSEYTNQPTFKKRSKYGGEGGQRKQSQFKKKAFKKK